MKKKILYEKFSKEKWGTIEKPVNAFAKKVLDCMNQLGILFQAGQFQQQRAGKDQVVIGDDLYVNVIRPQLVNFDLLPKKRKNSSEQQDEDEQQETKDSKKKVKKQTKQKKAKKPKKGSKKDKQSKVSKQELLKKQIVGENIRKDLKHMFQSFSMQNLNIQVGLRMKKIQLKLITFLYVCRFFAKNKLKAQQKTKNVFQLIFIMSKVLQIYMNHEGTSLLNSSQQIKISQQCLKDLKICVDILSKYYQYSVLQILQNHPKLIYFSIYDRYFQNISIKPYKNQLQIMKIVQLYFLKKKAPKLVFYRAMIGAGKTTVALAIASFLQEKHRSKRIQYSRMIYCCTVDSVREQLSKQAYNMGLKFAIGCLGEMKVQLDQSEGSKAFQDTHHFKREYKQIYQKYRQYLQFLKNLDDGSLRYNSLIAKTKVKRPLICRTVKHHAVLDKEKPYLIIADIFSTCQLLRQSNENTLLFFDQPTAYLGLQSLVTKKLMQITMKYLPALSILVSATMPAQKQIPLTVENIKRNFQKRTGLDIQTQMVISTDFQVGCQFSNFEGQIFYPHSMAQSKEQLESIIDTLKINPFILRLYTGPSMFALLKRCQEHGVKDLPKVRQAKFMNQAQVIQFSYQILDRIVKTEDNAKIAEICKPISYYLDQKKNKKLQKEQDDDDDGLFAPSQPTNQIKQKKSKKYVRLKKLCLRDSYKFMGGCLIGCQNPVAFAQKYFKHWVEDIPSIKKLIYWYEKDKEELEAKLQSIDKSQNAQLLGVQQKQMKKHQIRTQFNLKMKFPDDKKINTTYHYEKYGPKIRPEKQLFAPPVSAEIHVPTLQGQTQDWIIQLLLCGVALYSQSIGCLTKNYLSLVTQFASQGSIVYLLTDKSLCFGTNFPISNVILMDQLADNLTMSQIFQLIGRAGRVGQSWIARAFLQKGTLNKIEEMIKSRDSKWNSDAQILEQVSKTQQEINYDQVDKQIMQDILFFRPQWVKEEHKQKILKEVALSKA